MSKYPACPVDDFSCPYCDKYGRCRLQFPAVNCDDFAAFLNEEEEEEDRYTWDDLGNNWY